MECPTISANAWFANSIWPSRATAREGTGIRSSTTRAGIWSRASLGNGTIWPRVRRSTYEVWPTFRFLVVVAVPVSESSQRGATRREPTLNFRGGKGRTVHVALCDVAAVLAQRAQGGVVFDTLGDEVGSQAVSECHCRSHDRDGPGIERQPRDENLVQLQFVDGQILQPRQRRPPGPVVVKREAGAKTSQGGPPYCGPAANRSSACFR